MHDGWRDLNIPELPSLNLNHKEIVYFKDTEDYIMVAVDANDPMVVKLNRKDGNAEFIWFGGSLKYRVQDILLNGGAKIDSNTHNSALIAAALREYVARKDSLKTDKISTEKFPLDETEIEIILAYRKLKAADKLSKELKDRSAEQANISAEQHAIINEILMR